MSKTKINMLKKITLLSVVVLSIIMMSCSGSKQAVSGTSINPKEVKSITKKVADWQIRTFEDMGSYRALASNKPKWSNNKKYHELEWHCGALYAGMYEWSKIADDSKYTDWLKALGDRNEWKLHKRPYHADDHAVGQFYLNLYRQFGEKKMLEPTQKSFDWILDNPKTGSLVWDAGEDAHNRYGWCDALFMAPPVWARLASITGDKSYLDFMDQEYHASNDLLWDTDEHLFWRDSTFFPKREENGEKIFWARGNGWVFGGLALMIPDLPNDWEGKQFYIDLYKQMANKLKEIQRKDGAWSMGLLGGEAGYPVKETSGTSFYTFGLAWGVNQGILDRATFEPIITKAWKTLEGCVTKDGMLGYVQPVGAAPGDSFPDYTEVYGIGAFLAAGSEVYKLVGGK